MSTKLTVAIASLSLVKPSSPSTTVNSRLPSPQSLRSNTEETTTSEPILQDFEFLIGGSTLNPFATRDGPADVIALVQEMKGTWLGLFKVIDDLPLAWAQPCTGISCVNRRAHKYNDRVNGGHEGGSDLISTCRRCRLDMIPCVMAQDCASDHSATTTSRPPSASNIPGGKSSREGVLGYGINVTI
ncbi:hypothetical protein VE02_02292 [Pseudogymnoascus sp. 03VT05]|nr:hypothetical protein VE02_02292 [Pseudogymnoascus sp. 03VT05]